MAGQKENPVITGDMKNNVDRASILIESLPYIRKMRGQTFVIKYGGNAMINEELKQSVMDDITLLKYIGINPVIVHGGGPDISDMLNKVNKESHFVNGLRYTDEETMGYAQMVLIGKTNKDIVSTLCGKGAKAIGISGIDGNLIEAEKMTYSGVSGRTAEGWGLENFESFFSDLTESECCLLTEDFSFSFCYILHVFGLGIPIASLGSKGKIPRERWEWGRVSSQRGSLLLLYHERFILSLLSCLLMTLAL